ncbi:MAG: (2Fe-2S)-binding protein [Acidimicrobiaceae bacterium]|nr:(2Fe-2S)-binding protein [Acidimicrobiaceae bacterium]
MNLTLNINGTDHSVEFSDGELLLDVLRRLGLTSVREGCGVGACGSCTVLIDGHSVSSCLTLASRCENTEIQTSEGLGSSDLVVRAFIDAGALQCGYCIPGFVMMTTELLAENHHPDKQAISDHLEGNICRCGTYPEIMNAVLAAISERDK